VKNNLIRRVVLPGVGITALTLGLTACAGDDEAILIDGSSTVTPFIAVAGQRFQEETGTEVSVATSGTGGGFVKFCNGETAIAMASRDIKDEEIEACAENGIEYGRITVSNDGLAISLNNDNDWAECLTVDELASMWRAEEPVDNWADVREGFPDEPIELYGPGHDSGTFDFFQEVITGGGINPNYTDIGEDDNLAIEGTRNSVGASSFVPLSYIEESGGAVKAATITNDAGECVAPTVDSVQAGQYNPLGRELYVFPSSAALEREEVRDFLAYAFENQEEIALDANFVPLNATQVSEGESTVADLAGN
jgi:phosphate transport system substrate-binding protein